MKRARLVEVDLRVPVIGHADHTNITITNCDLAGMRIDDVPVLDMLEAYRRTRR